VIPNRLQAGTTDVSTWRVVPAPCNPGGDEQGGWAVAGGDAGDDPDLYFEISAECPKKVAEFIVAAANQHAHAVRFSSVVADVEQERRRERSRYTPMTPGNPHLPDALIDIIRRSLQGETFVPLASAFEITRSRPHGHVQAVASAIQRSHSGPSMIDSAKTQPTTTGIAAIRA